MLRLGVLNSNCCTHITGAQVKVVRSCALTSVGNERCYHKTISFRRESLYVKIHLAKKAYQPLNYCLGLLHG